MPLQIELRDRTGAVLGVAEESWRSMRDMWPDLPEVSFPLLSSVDRDGETMFNAVQCRRLRAELERLVESDDPLPRDLIGHVATMAERCGASSDLQLWFVGD